MLPDELDFSEMLLSDIHEELRRIRVLVWWMLFGPLLMVATLCLVSVLVFAITRPPNV